MTTPFPPIDPALDLHGFWQSYDEDAWLMSDWPAGQSSILQWSPGNVRVAADGGVELVLDRAPEGSDRPYQAGEVQSAQEATTGTWSWTVQAPRMVPGAVLGLFTYRSDWKNQPWVEFDFEFVGADTTRVQLNIHMLNAAGEHVTLDHQGRRLVRVDLGFDAAEGVHTYEITVTGDKAVFYVDGRVVGDFSGADMPGGVWNIGPMKSYINLWAVQPSQELWAGRWSDPAEPLVARIAGADVRPGEYGSALDGDLPADPDPDDDPATDIVIDDEGTAFAPTSFTLPDDALNLVLTGDADLDGTGNALDNRLTGNSGANVLDGASGADTMQGGAGDDLYIVGDAGDQVIEAAKGGADGLRASVSFALPLNVEILVLAGTADLDGKGNNLDNQILGNAGNNQLGGGNGRDRLEGGAGNDTLSGGDRDDLLVGGTGRDAMAGGEGADHFVFLDAADSGPDAADRDVIFRFDGSEGDRIDLSAIYANPQLAGDQAFRFLGTSGFAGLAGGLRIERDRTATLVHADLDGDGLPDLSIRLNGTATLLAEDFVL